MLQLIFQGFIEWSYEMTLESWQYFSTALLDIMSLDFNYLKTHIPIIDDIIMLLVAVGWALLIGNLVFQALKSMVSGLGFEGEDPKLLFARSFIFAFLLLVSPEICEIGLGITANVISLLQVPNAVNVTFLDETAFSPISASWLLVIIFDIILMFKVFQMILEMAERYVILAMLTITAPLAFAMGGSRATSEIFTGWCRMFGSMCLLMVTHVIFFKLLLSVIATVPSGIDVLPWMILILAIVKVARKADAIVTRIGLNPAITGDSLGVRIPGYLSYVIVRAASKNASAAFSKMFGSNTASHGGWGWQQGAGNTQQWWAGYGPPPATGYSGITAAGAPTSTTGETRLGAVQMAGGQPGADKQGAMPQQPISADGLATDTAVQMAETRYTGQSERTGRRDSTRLTAVPLGMRRAPTHIRNGTGGETPVNVVRSAGTHEERTMAENTPMQEQRPQPGTAGTAPAVQDTRLTRGTRGTAPVIQHGAASRVGGKSPEIPYRASVDGQSVQMGGAREISKRDTQSRITSRTSEEHTQRRLGESSPGQAQHLQPGTAGIGSQPSAGVPQTKPLQAGAVRAPSADAAAPINKTGSGVSTRITTRQESAPSARFGRNLAPSVQESSGGQAHSSPARQEPRVSSSAAFPSREHKVTAMHHDTAGKPQGLRPGQQLHQSVTKPAKDILSERRTGPSGTRPSSSMPKPKSGGKIDTKSARKTRGGGHGR